MSKERKILKGQILSKDFKSNKAKGFSIKESNSTPEYTCQATIGDSGHTVLDGDVHKTKLQIGAKIKENILSGRWPAETRAEIEMLRKHREELEKKKKK
tara:strand:- start:30842 stop:31138 length:297 start_codon:yes stop_codon:yes gene_type:complete